MGNGAKPIVVSMHATERMRQCGANVAEVERVIREAPWRPARRGKWSARLAFSFNTISPVNGRRYAWKTVEVVFADDPAAIVVVTVKVFYHDQ